jgi:transcription elongation factor SPT5
MTNSIKENEENPPDVDDIFDNNDSFSEESVTLDDAVIEDKSGSEVDNNASSSNIPYTNTQQQELKSALSSKFFAIRITGGQEQVVANILQNKITTKKINVFSILVLDNFKGYIIVEAPDANIAFEALHGVRHVRGQIRGELPFKDIEGYLVKKPVVTELNIDDTVEVIAGPFKAMKAKITRVDYEKQEATVILLDSPYQIPVTVDANYLKKLIQ